MIPLNKLNVLYVIREWDSLEHVDVSHQPSFKYKDETFLTIENLRECANDYDDYVLIQSLSFLCYLKDRNIVYYSFIFNMCEVHSMPYKKTDFPMITTE